MFNTFKVAAEAVGAEVHRVRTKKDALAFIKDFLPKEGIDNVAGAQALWANSSILSEQEKQQLSSDRPGLSFDVTRDASRLAKIGISEMDWGVANTGTVAQDATAIEQRLVSTLPIIHIAILKTNKIVADLSELLRKIDPRKNRYIRLITGPSRTADIERVLTIGVHGPERFVLLCVDEQQGENS